MSGLDAKEQAKQIYYRDARFKNQYDDIWQTVGKCVFCDLNEKYVLFEENGVVLTISLYAYIDGHCMIVPRRHVKSVNDLTQLEWEAVRKLIYIAKKLIKDIHGVKGMQIIQKDGIEAQSTVEHIHFHCVPFDSPDLNTWNMRQLKNTPLENVELYKKARKKIIVSNNKFDSKYHQPVFLPIICDAIIINEKDEVLLEERQDDQQLMNNYYTPPGGLVQDFDSSLEQELLREIKEETDLDLKVSDLTLLASQVSTLNKIKSSKYLKVKYKKSEKFLWNTYLIKKVKSNVKFKAGDDAKKIFWLPISEVENNDRVSPEFRQLVKQAIQYGK